MKTNKFLRSGSILVLLAAMLMTFSCKENRDNTTPEALNNSEKQALADNNAAAAAEVWNKANLTNYESYPDPGSEECIKFNGCTWAGQFAFLSGKQPLSWVKANNIISIHSKDAGKYKLKTLRLRKGNKTIDAKVYDMCSDSDCDGCCTINAKENGLNFLIDVEKYTMQRFGSGSGIVEWRCLDCN